LRGIPPTSGASEFGYHRGSQHREDTPHPQRPRPTSMRKSQHCLHATETALPNAQNPRLQQAADLREAPTRAQAPPLERSPHKRQYPKCCNQRGKGVCSNSYPLQDSQVSPKAKARTKSKQHRRVTHSDKPLPFHNPTLPRKINLPPRQGLTNCARHSSCDAYDSKRRRLGPCSGWR
jgi:hypothetical protein